MDREAELLSPFAKDDRALLISLAEIRSLQISTELSAVLDFIQAVSPDGEPIHKSSVRLELLGRHWPHLVPLVWTLHRGSDGDYTYGIVGQGLVDAGGFARRGMLLSSVKGAKPVIDMLDYLCEVKKLWYRTGTPQMQHQHEVVRLEVVSVPIVDDEGVVASFLNFTRYFWDPSLRSRIR